MNDKICRWGILGAATIAQKNWKSILRAENATLTAVASRSVERAQQFIHECQSQAPFPEPPRAVGGYDALLQSDDIDAVYAPMPTGLRKDWVVRAAEAGKHVLAEKPAAVNSGEVREMLRACEANGVQYMDGVMFMHSARLPVIKSVMNDGESIGALRRIVSNFSFNGPEEFHSDNIRVHSELEPLGCLGDLGWYNIRFILWAMDWVMPTRVSGRMLSQKGRPDSPHAVPTEFSAELFFQGGVSASFYCSFITENQQWIHLSGSKGSLNVSDFVLPFYGSEAAFTVSQPVFRIDRCEFDMQRRDRRFAVAEYSDGVANAQEINMIREFSRLASGTVDPSWGKITLQTQLVLDACLESARDDGAPRTPDSE